MKTTDSPPKTTAQWFAELLRKFAESFDASTIEAPTAQTLRESELQAAEIELVHAESQQETWRHTVSMLKARTRRLREASPS